MRAVRSLPFFIAFFRLLVISDMAFSARTSDIGFIPSEVKASAAWEKASIPVDAVIWGGSPSVSSGSTIASVAVAAGPITPFLVLLAVFETTLIAVISLPVPAVVGSKTRGLPGFISAPKPT